MDVDRKIPRSETIREPAVAGSFYPDDAAKIRAWTRPAADEHRRDAIGVLCPHAGWRFSGELAHRILDGVRIPQNVLIAGPNHTGEGPAISVCPPGKWRFPGFDVRVGAEVSESIVRAFPQARFDTTAHRREHACEVLLPFLYAANPDLETTVAVVCTIDSKTAIAFGETIADAISNAGLRRDFLFVASSDMTHYRPALEAERLDALVWPFLETLDAEGLIAVVETNGLSMCGYLPTAVMLTCVRRLGARTGTRIGYTHSGHATGQDQSVVTYAGYVFS